MKIKDYFKVISLATCPFCNKHYLIDLDGDPNIIYCEHTVDDTFIQFHLSYIDGAIKWIELNFYSDAADYTLNLSETKFVIWKNQKQIHSMPFDSVNCDMELKNLTPEWAEMAIIFS